MLNIGDASKISPDSISLPAAVGDFSAIVEGVCAIDFLSVDTGVVCLLHLEIEVVLCTLATDLQDPIYCAAGYTINICQNS